MATEERTLPVIAGAALGVVVVSGALFAGVGALRGGEDPEAPGVAAPTTEDPADGDSGGATDEATPGDGGTTEPTPVDSDTATDGPAEGDGDGATDGDETATEEPVPDVDPASVSIQVLDAVGTDGGAAAEAVAAELRDAGYDVIVVNQASVGYEVTTVFWTEGEGPGGRAVAATLGTDQAERTPDEVQLSDSVDVHVVVGTDRAG